MFPYDLYHCHKLYFLLNLHDFYQRILIENDVLFYKDNQ